MKLSFFVIFIVLFCSLEILAQENISEELKPFAPYVGKTWKGKFVNTENNKEITDVSRWERALNGNAIRILHSLNNGEYGGETLIFFDKEKNKTVFYYFTTANFYTTGDVKIEDGNFVSHEFVKGSTDGITEVKAIARILHGGRLHTTSKYLKNGEWVDGHEIIYEEAPSAEVIFK